MVITPDDNWYEVIYYVQKEKLYSHIYPISYDVRVYMILPDPLLV